MKGLVLELLRKAGLLATVFVVASGTLFGAIQLIPGDPVGLRFKNPDPGRVQEIREQLGLNDPIPNQYLKYVSGFLDGDWGRSIISGRLVREDLAEFFPATLELTILALALGVTSGVFAALCAKWLRWRILERLALGFGAIGLTVPIFWIGLMYIIIFSMALGWFPPGGRFDFTRGIPQGSGFLLLDSLVSGHLERFWIALQHLVLPVSCLALYPAALVSGILQARLEDPRIHALVRALRAKGLASWKIWFKHILRLLGAPVITVVGTNFGALLGGAIITETVFSWPGMGRYLVGGVLDRDLNVVENGLLLVILLAFSVVAVSDLVSFLANPVARKGVEP